MEAFRLGRIKIIIHFNRILPKLMAVITRHPRYVPDFEWNNLWTYNLFRVYEMVFGRRYGVRIETSVSCSAQGRMIVKCHSWESVIVHAEVAIRNFLKGMVPDLSRVRIHIPVLATPQGIFLPQPYLFAIAYDVSVRSGGTTTSPKTWSHTVTGSDPYLYLSGCNQVSGGGSQDISAASYNSVDMGAQIGGVNYSAGQNGWFQFFGLAGPATGAHNCSITFSSSNAHDGFSSSFSGAAQTGQPGAFNGETTAATTSLTVNITVGTTGSAIVTHAGAGAGQAITAGANTTVGLDPQAGDQVSFYSLNQAAGARTMNVTTASNQAYISGTLEIEALTTVTHTISVSDQLNLTDVITIAVISNINTYDQLNVTEAVTMLETSFVNVSDQLNVTESVSREANNFISVSDQLNITESVTIFINPLFISVSDQLNVTESVTTALFQETLTLSVSDQLNLTESIQTGLDNYISVNDSLTITESVSTSVQNNISVSDQLNITESVTPGLTSFISVSDQLNVTESVTKTVSDPARGLSYMRGFDQNLPVTMTKQDYPLGFNDTSVS